MTACLGNLLCVCMRECVCVRTCAHVRMCNACPLILWVPMLPWLEQGHYCSYPQALGVACVCLHGSPALVCFASFQPLLPLPLDDASSCK